MPRNQKNPQREEDELVRDSADAPRVDEIEEDDRSRARFDDEDEYEVDDDDIAEEIRIEELSAMEGPDA